MFSNRRDFLKTSGLVALGLNAPLFLRRTAAAAPPAGKPGGKETSVAAFDKDTGAELWSAKLPWVGNAPPATYQVNGRQFVVIAATGGNKLGTPYGDAYVAFALPRAD